MATILTSQVRLTGRRASSAAVLLLSAFAFADALTLDDVKKDPRFVASAITDDARVKVAAVADKFPYYGIPDNGCARGKSFVNAELLAPFDGNATGLRVVLRLDDPGLDADRVGTALSFRGLRRAGKAPDGTFVYCGKAPGPVPAAVSSASLPPPPPPPAAPANPPLPPVPDNGFVTELHKAKVGVIVFAASADAVTTPEKPALLRDSFTSSDSIFLRAYLPRSLNNAFRAEGVDCQEPFRIWSIKVDGVVVPRGKDDPYFYWEPQDDRSFQKSTSIRYDQALNAKAAGEASIGRAFTELVLPRMPVGEHTIALSVLGKCSSKNTKPMDAYLQAPMATGSFKLNVTTAAPVALLSKPGMKDPKLVKEATGLIEAQWGGDKVQKMVLVGKAWEVETIMLKGVAVPQKRRLDAEVAVKQTSGACRVFNITLIQPATNMTKFGATEFSTGESREVDCAALK